MAVLTDVCQPCESLTSGFVWVFEEAKDNDLAGTDSPPSQPHPYTA